MTEAAPKGRTDKAAIAREVGAREIQELAKDLRIDLANATSHDRARLRRARIDRELRKAGAKI